MLNIISIKTGELSKNQYQLKKCLDRIIEIEESFHTMQYSIDNDIRYQNGIQRKIVIIEDDLNRVANGIYRLSDFLKNTKDDYDCAENEIEKLACSLNNITQSNEDKKNNNTNKDSWLVSIISSIGFSDMVRKFIFNIEKVSKLFSDKIIKNNNENSINIEYNKSHTDVDIKIKQGMILNEGIYQGKVKNYIDGKDIIEFKKSLENILKNYEGFEVNLKDENGNYNNDIDGNLDKAVYKFLYGYEEYHSGNYLMNTYDALPDEYKLTALLHWAKMIENNYSTLEFGSNLLPKEYYENMPPLPLQDNEIGKITCENKYDSTVAYEYYVKHYYPLDAINEINYSNWPEESKKIRFKMWARLTYGSSKEEREQEFKTGVLLGVLSTPERSCWDTLEGIYTVISDFDQVKIFAEFMAKAAFYSEYREALFTMIGQAIEEWKIAYNEAEPYDKGVKIGCLIGESLTVVLESGKSASDIVKYIKSGNFLKSFKGVVNKTKMIKKLRSAKIDDLLDNIHKISRKDTYFEIISPEQILYKIDFDKLSANDIKLFNQMVDNEYMSEAERKKLASWRFKPSSYELYIKYRDIYNDERYYNQETGAVIWPVNDGFEEGTIEDVLVKGGTIFKRYGEDKGEFLGNTTDSFESRSLAMHSENAPIHYYQLIDDEVMTTGKAAKWFGREGGAEQFVVYKNKDAGTKYTIKELVDKVILIDITDKVESGEIVIDE